MPIFHRIQNELRNYDGLGSALRSFYSRAVRRIKVLPGRGRVVHVRVPGIQRALVARLGTTDFEVIDEMFFPGEYQPVVNSLACDQVRCVVDLGSNIGLSARLWLERFPRARVLLVEPDAGNASVLRLNVTESGHATRAHVEVACVAASTRKVSLDRSGGEWAFRMHDQSDSGGDAIDAWTLPELLQRAGMQFPIDLVKCDIEGAEAELFANCAPWIGQVKRLIVEVHLPYDEAALMGDLARAQPGAKFQYKLLKQGGGHRVLDITRA